MGREVWPGILQSGIAEKRTPGFWNNVGICCGSAGVAEFFLNLYRVQPKRISIKTGNPA